jgi:hypothetical protein
VPGSASSVARAVWVTVVAVRAVAGMRISRNEEERGEMDENERKRRNEQDKNCRCKPKCLDCRDGVHDGCMYECR